jgi:hypothetical protein
MIYKAYSSDAQKLLSLPETGMGYQVIDAKLYGQARSERYIVYNGELIVNLDIQFGDNKRQIITKGFSNVLNEAKALAIETNSISLVSKSQIIETRMMSESKKNTKHRYSGGKGAKDNPKESANGTEDFVRLSAYDDDKRVDFVNKRLIDGTYTTTYLDYNDCVTYQDDPIDRYALPNDETIKWAFYVKPKTIDVLQRGIVQPVFGHDGGGIEAYFEKRTSNDTYFDRRPYGK